MNLWCSPSPKEPQSSAYVYHAQVPTNGSNPQSFPYSNYNRKGVCHMQVESFSGDDFANTPHVFSLTSDDSSQPNTWGIGALGEAGGSPNPSHIQELPAIPSTVLAATTSELPSAASSSLSSSLESPTPIATTPPPPPRPSNSSNSNQKTTLTSAVKAGISIGSIFSFLAIVLIFLLARLLWSRRRRQHAGPQDPQSRFVFTENRMAGTGERRTSRYEMGGEGMPNELQGRPRAELSGEMGGLAR
ncbi:MAG: hypothetical protein Q9170_004900 [Blastenia crenularia]